MATTFRSIVHCAWILVLLAGCAAGPIDYPRESSEAVSGTEGTLVGRIVSDWQTKYPGQSGFYPLHNGMDALGARHDLMEHAERTIDVQYFLMKPDAAGLIFSSKLLEAADRGVRVRFLLDDIFTSVDDKGLLLLDAHPNIEIRLFNPVARSGFYYFNYVGDFKRANRRMHNKSFIIDNQVGIVGGRNIAAEYFELEEHGEFIDFDMLAVGDVVPDVSVTFDRFWNHELSVPMQAFADAKSNADLDEHREELIQQAEKAGDNRYADAIDSTLVQDIFGDFGILYPASANVVTDDPDKATHKTTGEDRILINALTTAMEKSTSEVIIITPYLIPGDGGLSFIQALRERGIRVIVFTNSLASTNHVSVHGGYSRYRKPLLEAGVELHEARAYPLTASGKPDRNEDKLTLHTKGIIIDRRLVMVGSLNLDPRSVDINTEMGVLIDSETLGASMAETALEQLSGVSYRLSLEDGDIRWQASMDDQDIVVTSEPQSSGWRRFKSGFSRILPESQL